VRQAVEAIGPIDILVNNAGIQHVCPVEDFPVEKWDQIIALNLSAAFHTTRLVVKGMKERGWGRIVNVASAHALVASPFKSAYVSAKHGILGLTKTVALETAEHGVTVNAVCPGYVLTPARREADSRHGQGPRHDHRAGQARRAARRATDQAVR
jgi:3-hydroxybutyrate dehydrogenase